MLKHHNSTARLIQESRYLVSLMQDSIPDQKLQKAINILDQCIFALKFYEHNGQDKYIDELTWAVKRLYQLFNEKGEQNE